MRISNLQFDLLAVSCLKVSKALISQAERESAVSFNFFKLHGISGFLLPVHLTLS